MNTKTLSLALALGTALSASADFRAPAYPLVTIDPNMSAWSRGDTLYQQPVQHWTYTDFHLLGVVNVDGTDYRFMGEDFTPFQTLVPTSEAADWSAKYTITSPTLEWSRKDFDDSAWKTGQAPFGTELGKGWVMVNNEFCGMAANTLWDTTDIWLRRPIVLENTADKDIYMVNIFDDLADIFINGHQIEKQNISEHRLLQIPNEYLIDGENMFAIHVTNTGGYAILDFGLMAKPRTDPGYQNTAVQTSVDVTATSTIYTFTCGPVDLKVTFTAPLLPDDLNLLSRPVNYISYNVTSNDGKAHNTSIMLSASQDWARDYASQKCVNNVETQGNLTFMSTGTTTQDILSKWGDSRRIDWGYFYLGGNNKNTTYDISGDKLSLDRKLGNVKKADGFFMIGYDDIYSINYLGTFTRAYWNRDGKSSIWKQFKAADKDYTKIMARCSKFDKELYDEALAAGGSEYAYLCVLAYRQCIAAHKLIETADGTLAFLSKENDSNGSIGTVDVTYPSFPLFVRYNIDLAKGLLNPIFEYCATDAWGKPFAAHDIGRYPRGLGQNYGGDMPVEESGNMLVMTALIADAEGNSDYAAKNWPLLTQWVEYLREYGVDPESQLCTDDFAGHLARNANLSAKAIMGMAAYGYLAGMQGDKATEQKYFQYAKGAAAKWKKLAAAGDHYALAFEHPETWSQKYNIVWDKYFGWNIFDKDIIDTEIKYYLTKQNPYGLPLDNRSDYTKSDWIVWTASMADNDDTFKKFITPLHHYYTTTPDRRPMGDWYWSSKPYGVGFKARSVVGGMFIKTIMDRKLKK